jgi:tRNA threonylcarbamoyladenosine biosynthesis protein TsaE
MAFAKRFAASLPPGSVIALSGDLGAGKTTFVKGIVGEATSPTFTLIHEYPGPVYHIDLYRLETAAQALAIGIEDYLPGNGLTIIEWAERIAELLPPGTKRVHLKITGENSREITIT